MNMKLNRQVRRSALALAVTALMLPSAGFGQTLEQAVPGHWTAIRISESFLTDSKRKKNKSAKLTQVICHLWM